MYLVTKQFKTGILKGLTIVDKTSVLFEVGLTYKECVGSGSYLVTEVVPAS
jgi:hypothetical protein